MTIDDLLQGPRGYLSVPTVAQFLSISIPTMNGILSRGEMVYVRCGRTRRIACEELCDYLARNTVSRTISE